MTSPSTDTRCCAFCTKDGEMQTRRCSSCPCHTEPKEWEAEFDERFGEPMLDDDAKIREEWGSDDGARVKPEQVKSFITETIAKEVEKAKQEGAKELVAQIRGKTALLTSVDWEDLQDILSAALVEYLRPHKLK